MQRSGCNSLTWLGVGSPDREGTMEKVNLRDKLALFSDHWSPKVVGDLNGQ
jgi:hypothetical protein